MSFSLKSVLLPVVLVSVSTGALAQTYAEVAPLVETNCVSCHGPETAYADLRLDSEASLVANKKAVYDAIVSGYMPLGDEGWKDTADGKKVLSYLENLP
jgi:mono/diheme cytochrome c family protein